MKRAIEEHKYSLFMANNWNQKMVWKELEASRLASSKIEVKRAQQEMGEVKMRANKESMLISRT